MRVWRVAQFFAGFVCALHLGSDGLGSGELRFVWPRGDDKGGRLCPEACGVRAAWEQRCPPFASAWCFGPLGVCVCLCAPRHVRYWDDWFLGGAGGTPDIVRAAYGQFVRSLGLTGDADDAHVRRAFTTWFVLDRQDAFTLITLRVQPPVTTLAREIAGG